MQRERKRIMKGNIILSIIGIIGGALSTLYGGWTNGMTTLMIFMTIDYITGLMVAGVFKKSMKSDTGALESRAGFKGLCRKGMILLIVLVACRLDVMAKTTFVRDACITAFSANEAISIIENAGLMGLWVPPVLVKAIDVLKKKGEREYEQKRE